MVEVSTGAPGRFSIIPRRISFVGVTEWGSGPSVAFLKKDEGPWVLGAVINNIWSFGGPPTSNRTNSMLLNPIVSYHFGDGWAVGSSPNITSNWIASGAKWTVPVGASFSKTVELGAQPKNSLSNPITTPYDRFPETIRGSCNSR
jgi:hypothetical protein